MKMDLAMSRASWEPGGKAGREGILDSNPGRKSDGSREEIRTPQQEPQTKARFNRIPKETNHTRREKRFYNGKILQTHNSSTIQIICNLYTKQVTVGRICKFT
jgi:hypothetical protein